MWLLIVWLVMGVTALCGALCYGELSARYPEAGGGYVYLREAYGPAVAFMYGWMAFLVMDPGLSVAELAELGVRRISVGGALARVAWAAVLATAERIKAGSFDGLAAGASGKQLNDVFGSFT